MILKGPVSIANSGSEASMGAEFEPMSHNLGPVNMMVDLEAAIATGTLPIEEVTGGVRVDALTGKVHEPKAKPDEPTLAEVRSKATAEWLRGKRRGSRVGRALKSLDISGSDSVGSLFLLD